MSGKFGALRAKQQTDYETPRQMDLMDPVKGQPIFDAEGKKAFIELLSDDSKAAKDFERANLDRRISRRTRPTAEELEEENLHRAAKLTKGWHLVAPDGEVMDLPCTEANAIELYKEMPEYLEQVQEFCRNRANFKKT